MRRARDLTDMRLENAVVVSLAPVQSGSTKRWLCRCDCGAEFTAFSNAIIAGYTKRCRVCTIAKTRPALTGQRVNGWLVIARRKRSDGGSHALWILRCVRCQLERTLTTDAINHGVGLCECAKSPPRRDHPLYPTWTGMRQRCLGKTNLKYKDYGGRGIKICERWMSFENFIADVGERPPGTSLDRIDVNGNYEPGNVRWATPQEQSDNQRLSARRVERVLLLFEAALRQVPNASPESIVSTLRGLLLGA